jgi:class 3 adenylate cyclase/tetratricopeptide (TPR) repeat protein
VTCGACGRENREGAAFCDACGASLAPRCPKCDAQVRADARFCDACGTSLAAEPQPDLRARTPAHLARKILEERGRIEGERRTVTVLFADAKGFTPMSERMDEEKVYAFVQGCVERMVGSVHRYEGTVTQFTGDGIVALFGAPIAHEDSARRAVAAALDIQHALHDYIQAEDIDTAFRIGLNTGPVVVGRVSDDLTMDYTAIGDTVNLAARMEQMAEPGTVFITQSTYEQVADYIDCGDLGLRDVKGKSEPVHIYEAVRERDVRSRMDASVARGLSPFVGRDRDIDVLKGLWKESLAGRGQIVMISGEPGIGKSRLLLEFHRALDEDVIWREAHCVTYGEEIPYLPVIELVKNGFGITDADDEGTMIGKVDADTAIWSPEAQKTAPYLKFLLQVDPGDAAIEQMDPMERRAGILDALRALILERSRVAPRVVVIEDLHWADDQSEEAFRVCADAVVSSRVLMILTFRPGYMHPSADLPNAHRVVLGNLDADARSELAGATLSASHLPADLIDGVTRKAEGNPLFIEEVTKALASGVADPDAVPNSLQDVILARIDRLEHQAREALQLASVIGREFTLRLLDQISDLKAELQGVLGDLKMLELIYEKTFFPELAYMFKHALTHDVAYSTLLLERRKALHHIVASAIEELYPERLVEHYETLAYHYERAENWPHALEYLTRSAEKAANAYAIKDAIRFYERARTISERLGDHAAVAMHAYRSGLLNISVFAIAEALADLERMLVASRSAEDDHLVSLALAGRSVAEFFAHEFEAGEASGKAALELGSDGFDDTRFIANLSLAGIYIVTGRLDEGFSTYEEGRRFLSDDREPLLVSLTGEFDVLLRNWKGDYPGAIAMFEHWVARYGGLSTLASVPTAWAGCVALGGAGDYDRALDVAREAISVSERTQAFPDFRARALNTTGWILGEIEDHEQALEWNTRGWEAALEIGAADPEFENNALLNMGDNLAALGDLDRAEERYRQVERIVQNPAPADRWMMWRYSQHLFHSLGELHLMRGDPVTALAYADRCLEGASETEAVKNVVKAKRLRGQALAALGEVDRAGAELNAALVAARQIGNPPQLWKTLAAIAGLSRTLKEDPTDAEREAEDVLGRMADRLSDDRARATLLNSERVRAVRSSGG